MSQTCLGAPSCHDAPGPGVSALETSLVLPLSALQTSFCGPGLGAAHVLEPPTGTEQSQGQAAWEAGDTGAAHGYGAAQGAAHDDGAALCQRVFTVASDGTSNCFLPVLIICEIADQQFTAPYHCLTVICFTPGDAA